MVCMPTLRRHRGSPSSVMPVQARSIRSAGSSLRVAVSSRDSHQLVEAGHRDSADALAEPVGGIDAQHVDMVREEAQLLEGEADIAPAAGGP